MTNWRARARLLAFACVAGLALSACGGDDGAQAGGTETDQANGSDGEEQSPLSEFLGEGAGFATGERMVMSATRGDMTEEDRQQMRQVEELVAECMQEKGFEYIPIDPSAGDGDEDPFADAYSLPPDEFAREYGYGMTTLMRPEGPDQESPDPNQDIRDGLSEAALEEYNRALWGELAEVSEGGGAVAIKPAPPGEGETTAPEDLGCHRQASNEVYGESDMMTGPDMSEFDGLFEDMEALRERIDSDPRLVEATEAWAACMAEAGYSEFGTTTEPEDSVMEQMSELYGWDTEGDEGGPNVTIGGPEEVDVDEAALQELQEYEIAVATADYDCEQEHYADVQRDVAWDFEEQFVEEHRAELERYRGAMAEGPMGRAGGLG